jgi:hypothetical protein
MTMLKWTCRLRDTLERRRLWVHETSPNPLSNLREAECDNENAIFPDSFRWDTLRGCLRDEKDACTTFFTDPSQGIGLVPAFEQDDSGLQSGRRLTGTRVADLDRQDIDVLWLSPSVFMSTVDFKLPDADGAPIHANDYAVRLAGKKDGEVLYYAYSMPFFEGTGFAPPSPLPVQLLRHVAANLPDGYFEILKLEESLARIDERLPLECVLHFVSIAPFDPTAPSKHNDAIQLKIGTQMNLSDLEEVFSHHFHPLVKLSFSQRNPFDIFALRDRFDKSVSLSAFLHFEEILSHSDFSFMTFSLHLFSFR